MSSLRLTTLLIIFSLITASANHSNAIIRINAEDAKDLPVPGFMDLNSMNIIFHNKTKILKVIVKYYNILPIKFINTNINIYVRSIESGFPILIVNMSNDGGLLKIIFYNQSSLFNAYKHYFIGKQIVSEFNLTTLPFNIAEGKYLVNVRSEITTWDVFGNVLFYKPGGVTRVKVDGEPYDWLFVRFLTLYSEGRDTYYGVRNEGLDMDYSAVLLTDNSTHIILRVDPIEEPALNPYIIRELNLLVDVDNDDSTGYLVDEIGSDYYANIKYIASSRRNITAILNLYRWNSNSSKFKNILSNVKFYLNKFKVIEGAIPIGEIKPGSRIKLKIWVDNIAVDYIKKVVHVE